MELFEWIIACYVFVAVSEACVDRERDFDKIWTKYKKVYGKQYCRNEDSKRRGIWNKALRRTIIHNFEFDLGMQKYRRGLNKYSDLTHEEFASTLNGFLGVPESRKSNHNRTRKYKSKKYTTLELPKKLDWRDEDIVSSVKDQGLCGSCWAFSAVASLESQFMKKSKSIDIIDLSEQNLVDCSSSHGNKGCKGGLMTQAFDYIIENGGIEAERTYPYNAKEGDCRFQESNVAAKCRSYEEIESGDEDALLAAIVNVGPISVGIDSSLQSFQDYKGGIYDDPSCSSENLDHAVLAIGYGTEDGTDYWLIKNSHGTSWGEDGYGKIARNNNNQCGIATQACYPIV